MSQLMEHEHYQISIIFPDLLPVTDFSVITTARSAQVSASPPNVTDGLVTSYMVSYGIVGSSVMTVNFSTEFTLLSVTIQPLLPFTNYVFVVRACTIIGCSPVSDSITVMTLEDGKYHLIYLFCNIIIITYK